MRCPKCQSDNPDTLKFCGECGTQLIPEEEISVTETLETSKEELTTGSIFAGRYQIIEELGKGGMGRVYKAHDTEIKEKVALKLLKPEIASDEKTIERFRNELKIARRVSHKRVCRMYDIGKEEEKYFITMEYVEGGDLKSLIRAKGKISENEVMRLAKQICEGLAEAHELGIVHRDLKPQNIMIDEKSNVKVMDFGIARSVEAPGVTQTGVMIGTPDYISPEQAEGEEADQRSDVYSLGIILYEMVTGTLPFEGDTALSVALKHKSQLPKEPRKLNPEITEQLSRLILICMEKDRERRYQTAEALLADLRNIEEGFPLGTKSHPRRETFTAALIRKKLFFPGMAFLIILILGLMIWYFFFRAVAPSVDPGRPSLAIMYFENNTGDEELDYWRKALSDLMIMDLSQSKYIYVLPGDMLLNILDKLDQTETRSYSSDVLKEVALRGAVNHILLGNYVKAGDTIRINVMLKKAGTNEILGSESAEGEGLESIFPMVDDLTKRIKSHLPISVGEIADDIDLEGAKIATSSPDAFRLFSEAYTYLWKGNYQTVVSLLRKAIAIDTEFASAYYILGWCYNQLGYPAEAGKSWKKALNLTDRLRDREKYLIQATFYQQSFNTHDKALQSYTILLELYPEDLMGNLTMGIFYKRLGEYDKALERLNVPIQKKTSAVFPYWNAAQIHELKGLYDKAIEILEHYLDNFSENYILHEELAWIYAIQRKFDLALSEADKALSLAEGILQFPSLKGDIYLFQDDFTKAREEYETLILSEEKSAQRLGRSRLGYLLLTAGKIEEAKKYFIKEYGSEAYCTIRLFDNNEELLEIFDEDWNSAVKSKDTSWQIDLLVVKGEVYIRMNALEEALNAANHMKELIEKGLNKSLMRKYDRLIGLIELKKGNYDKALEHFGQAVSSLTFQASAYFTPNAQFIEPFAFAYYRAGDLDNALKEYQRITQLTQGRKYSGDIYAKSFYMLGKIYEEQGNTAKAIVHYEKFLSLWKNADHGIAEVEDSKKRLAGLKSQTP